MAAATSFSLTYQEHTLDQHIFQGLDQESSAQLHPLGFAVRSTDGRKWVYSLTSEGANAATAGGPAMVGASTVANTVTSDVSVAGTTGQGFVGVYMLAATDAYYVWIQTKGKVLANVSTTSVGVSLTVLVDDYFDTGTVGSNEQVASTLENSGTNELSFPAIMLTDN